MPINPQIPMMAGQGVPQVKSLSDVMTDMARIKTAEAQVRRMDALSAQEAENARKVAEAEGRRRKAEGLFQQYGQDPQMLRQKLIENGMPAEAMEWDKHVADHQAKVADAASKSVKTQAELLDILGANAGKMKSQVGYGIMAPWVAQHFPDIAADLPPTYEEAAASGILDKIEQFAVTEKARTERQGAAFDLMTKDGLSDLSAYAALAEVDNQQELDAQRQLWQAYGVGAEKLNKYPSVFTEGMKEEYAGRLARLKGATAQGDVSWQSDEMMLPDGKGGTVKANVWKNPKTRQIVDASGKDVSADAQPVVTGQTTDEKTIEEAAQNIVNNPRDLVSLRSVTTMRGEQRLQLFNAIKRLNPNFNIANVDRQIKFLDAYEDPKGRAASNRASMNNILMHAADLSTVNKEYRRSDVKLANTALNKLAGQYSEVYTRYMVPLTVLQNEIALYFAGGYAPDIQEKKDWDRILTGDATPNQIEAFAKSLIHVGLRRADTHNQQFKTMMGFDDPNLLTPDAMQAGKQLGMAGEMSKYGSGGKIGDKPFVGVFPGGEEGFNTQAELDAFIKQAKEQHGVTVTPRNATTTAPDAAKLPTTSAFGANPFRK